MEIKAVKFRKNGFYTQPFAFGGEEGTEKFDKNIRYPQHFVRFFKRKTGKTPTEYRAAWANPKIRVILSENRLNQTENSYICHY